MISFDNEKGKNPGLRRDQICHIIGEKPNSFN